MSGAASADEAAAIAAAVQRFVADEMAAQAPPPAMESPWARAALLEGVAGKRTIEDLEGGMR